MLGAAVAAVALAAGAMAPREVSFSTPDGGIVYADLYGSGDRGVVLAHGGRFNKASWEKQAPALAENGFHVLAIDFRGRGRSRGGPSSAAGEGLRFDVLGAVRYLTARDDPRADGKPRLVGIRQQYESAPEPKELVILDGSAHAQFLFDTDQAARLMREILRFLAAP